jgi:hypothetical protein
MRYADLKEERYPIVTLPNGKEVTTIRNPSVRELTAWIERSRSNELRGVISGKDLIVWDSYQSDHSMTCKSIGVEYHDTLPLYFNDDTIDVYDLSETKWADHENWEIHDFIINHPAMRRIVASERWSIMGLDY